MAKTKRVKRLSKLEKEEIKDILFFESSGSDKGILKIARNRALTGNQLDRIARVEELIERL